MKVEHFRDAVRDISGVEWYGFYRGRNHFEGYAITIESLGSLIEIGACLHMDDLTDLIERPPHTDNLGLGLIVAWPKRLFEDGEKWADPRTRTMPDDAVDAMDTDISDHPFSGRTSAGDY